jgi:phosphoglycolate phosphatase
VAYKAIIFDLDGTLVDTLADLTNSMNFALAKFGQPGHQLHQCREMIGSGLDVFVEKALSNEKQHLKDKVLSAMLSHYGDNCLKNSRLYDGIADMINKLSKMGVHLAILTNKQQPFAEQIIEHFFGNGVFEVVAGAHGAQAVKPEIKMTMKIVDSMGLVPRDFLFVGDSDVDIQTAAQAQIRSVAVAWGFRQREQLAKARPDVIIDNPVEILDLIA